MSSIRIGILTSGGDSPGMNVVIQKVVSQYPDVEVLGFLRGYEGLIEGDYVVLNAFQTANIHRQGGTILKSSRCARMQQPGGVDAAVAQLQKLQIGKLIVIGGDGTFAGAQKLQARAQIPVIGIPGTIDGDITGSETTIGYATAVENGHKVLRLIEDTARSHDRIFIVEVMGRYCGKLAEGMAQGLSTLAVITPEQAHVKPAAWCEQIQANFKNGQGFLVLITEHQTVLRDYLQEALSKLGYDVRTNVLGHLQRGGPANPTDYVLATRMAGLACSSGTASGMVAAIADLPHVALIDWQEKV